MKVTQEDLAQRQVVLNIEVESEDLEPYLQRAHRQLAQRVNVPGFRKGKAPRHVVERLIGHENLLHEALHALVPDMADRAVTEQGLAVSAMPEVEIVETDPLVMLKATVPLAPEVELSDYRSLRIETAAVESDEGAVEEAIEQIRRESTPWEPVERPVQMEDLAVIDLTGSIEGEYVINQKDASYVVNEERFPAPGFGEALVGMQQSETREFTLTFPEGEDISERVAGKPCDFVVTLKDLKERQLPELDDEFAKGVGNGYNSLEALREFVGNQLRGNREREAQGNYEAEVVERVLQDSKVELPPLLIQREIDRLLEDMQESSSAGGQRQADVDSYVESLGKTQEEIRAELEPRALERLQRAAVLSEIADRENMDVSQEALDEEIAAMVQMAGTQGDQMRRFFEEPRNQDSVSRNLRTRLTIQRIAAIARGEEVDPERVESEEPPAAEAEEEGEPREEESQA